MSALVQNFELVGIVEVLLQHRYATLFPIATSLASRHKDYPNGFTQHIKTGYQDWRTAVVSIL